MSRASVKRSYDVFSNSTAAPMDLSSISNVSVISGQDEDCRPPAAKRMRGATSTYAAPRTETKRENPFIPPQLDLAKLVEFPKQTKKEVKMVQQAMVEQKRPTEAKDIAQSMSLSGSLGAPKPVPRLFTEEQVLKIVEDACRCRDEQTSQRFNEIHNEAMRELWESFSTFNQDYVARQMKRSDASYFS